MEPPMKSKKILSTILTFILLLGLPFNAYAAQWTDFTDISGHWAEETVQRGFNDGLITGFEDNTLAPDAPITTAQMITILCRVLGATETADASSLGISSDAWYFSAAGKALHLGLISAATGNLEAPMTRQDALAMLAKAFCLVPAEANLAELSPFSDAGSISAENKAALASLVSDGIVTGFGGALDVNSSITRAEFLTVLYRVAQNYITSDKLTSGTQGGSIVKGNAFLSYISTGKLWFDCSAESVLLYGVKADTVTLLNHKLTNLNINSGCDISSLVIAAGSGSASLDSIGSSKIGQLRLESCTSASIGSGIGSVEITGSGISASVSGEHDYLIITGSNNTITLSSDARLTRLKIMGENNIVKAADTASLSGNISCGEIEVLGKSNTLAFNSSSVTPFKITIGGTENSVVSAFKSISALSVTGTKANIKLSSLTDITDFSVSGSENNIEVTSALSFSASISGSLNNISAKSDTDMAAVLISGSSNWLSLLCADLSSVSISGN